jgi:hypothetical protein
LAIRQENHDRGGEDQGRHVRGLADEDRGPHPALGSGLRKHDVDRDREDLGQHVGDAAQGQ